jgi:hypothetical protein
MEIDQDEAQPDRRYRVVSVQKIDAPEGMAGTNWHRYVIARGTSLIKGLRTGTLRSVTAHAENYVEVLNDRSVRGYSSYASRQQKR